MEGLRIFILVSCFLAVLTSSATSLTDSYYAVMVPGEPYVGYSIDTPAVGDVITFNVSFPKVQGSDTTLGYDFTLIDANFYIKATVAITIPPVEQTYTVAANDTLTNIWAMIVNFGDDFSTANNNALMYYVDAAINGVSVVKAVGVGRFFMTKWIYINSPRDTTITVASLTNRPAILYQVNPTNPLTAGTGLLQAATITPITKSLAPGYYVITIN
jgi:hypothetical protein